MVTMSLVLPKEAAEGVVLTVGEIGVVMAVVMKATLGGIALLRGEEENTVVMVEEITVIVMGEEITVIVMGEGIIVIVMEKGGEERGGMGGEITRRESIGIEIGKGIGTGPIKMRNLFLCFFEGRIMWKISMSQYFLTFLSLILVLYCQSSCFWVSPPFFFFNSPSL